MVALAALLFVSTVAIASYMTFEGFSFIDSLYMVIITLSTVGFMEVLPLSQAGRIITMFVIFVGVGSYLYLAGTFAQLLVEGKLQMFLGRRRVLKTIESLRDHFIVCGYGRIGSIVANEIQREGHPVVVIERDPEIVERLESEGMLFVDGDATSDETLQQAGLDRAKSLVTALTQEASNVYVTLTARQLNPHLNIIARADSENHIPRLERAGADRVVTPHIIGGIRMAQSVLRPAVINFMELAMRGRSMELQMEEVTVSRGSAMEGKNLMESNIRPDYNVIIIGIKKHSGAMIFNPGPKTEIQADDTLITVGNPENLKELRKELMLEEGKA
jgi:voltage-gated potassium channel